MSAYNSLVRVLLINLYCIDILMELPLLVLARDPVSARSVSLSPPGVCPPGICRTPVVN